MTLNLPQICYIDCNVEVILVLRKVNGFPRIGNSNIERVKVTSLIVYNKLSLVANSRIET